MANSRATSLNELSLKNPRGAATHLIYAAALGYTGLSYL